MNGTHKWAGASCKESNAASGGVVDKSRAGEKKSKTGTRGGGVLDNSR